MRQRTFELLLAVLQGRAACPGFTTEQVAKEAAIVALSFADLDELEHLTREGYGIVRELARKEWTARQGANRPSAVKEPRSGDNGSLETRLTNGCAT